MTSRSRFCDLSAGSAFETKASPYSTWSGRGRSSPERRSPPSGLADRGRLAHLAPASPCRLRNVLSRATSLHGRYSASPLLPAPPPPSRLRPISRRGEEGFSSGSMCPGHRAVAPTPPEGPTASAALRWSLLPSPSGCGLGLRIFALSGPPLRSLALRPGDSPAIPKMTVSMGFRSFGFPPACHPSYGASALTPAGLTPAEHISLLWTHNRTGTFSCIRLSRHRICIGVTLPQCFKPEQG